MNSRKVLLVEGEDDKHVIAHICGNRGIGKIEIRPAGNDIKLLESLPVQLKESNLGALGLVIDSDLDLDRRWASVRDRLCKAGYSEVPKNPTPEGLILPPQPACLLPQVGIWLMPNNKLPGKLEDFLHFLVPANDQLFDHARSSVDKIPEFKRPFSPADYSKVLLYTWLAWQKEPGRPFGTAITAKFLDPHVPQACMLVDWLKRLYGMESVE